MALSSASTFGKRRRVRGAMVEDLPPPSPSAMSLINDLAELANEISICEKPKARQKRNCSHLVQRVKLLAPAFEEVRDCSSPLPPSALLAFREMFGMLQRVKLLLEDCREGSCTWLLLNRDSISQQFHEISQDMATILRRLPLNILEISVEVKEQVELVRVQTERAKQYLDSTEEKLQEELLTMLDCFKRRKPLDTNRLMAILPDLQLESSEDCEREMRCLREEITAQSGNEDLETIFTVRNLLGFVGSCQRLLYGPPNCSTEASAPDPSSPRRSENNAIAEASTLIPADEFRCPISLELMKDPVIVASGQTYDRMSIARWIASGHCTCPKSGQKLTHLNLIPNYALRSLINQWCENHKLHSDHPSDGSTDNAYSTVDAVADRCCSSAESLEATKITAAFLVGKLATGSPDVQRQVAYELRLLAKTGMDNRKCIAEAGAIPFLLPLLSSKDPKTQEHAVTALLNLSIFDNNKKLIMAAGALEPILQVLSAGNMMEARENAAATVFSLSVVDEFKIIIGSSRIAIPAVVKLLREGSAQGKKDAATTLFNLSLYSGNKTRVVSAGAVPVIVHLLRDHHAESEITDDALAVLALLAVCPEGLCAIRSASTLPVLINLLRHGSSRSKENSIGVMLALCRNGGEHTIGCILQLPDAVPALQTLILSTGTPRAKRKASSLLKLLQHTTNPFINRQQPLISSTSATPS